MASIITKTSIFFSKSLKQSVSMVSALNQSRHYVQGLNTTTSRLIYSEFGDPAKVITKEDCVINTIEGNEVLVKMLASPVNPADINTIEGKYPVKPDIFPAVPGNEGVGEIAGVGSQVTNFQIGDRVILYTNAVGTWRTHLAIQTQYLYKVPKKLGIIEAATLTVNPCTAYRMLLDYIKLKPGDTVIQNGGNSAVGQAVIQLAKNWGINTVNIVRDREDIADLKESLMKIGASVVLTEQELRTTKIFKDGEYSKPRLALNCVGGKNSLELCRHLDKNATMVTYGGMSRQPVTIPTGVLIFKDLKLRGFWMTEWAKNVKNTKERQIMLETIIKMMLEKKLLPSKNTLISFDKYMDAICRTEKVGKKFIFDFRDSKEGVC